MTEEKYKDVFLAALLSNEDLIKNLTGQIVLDGKAALLDGYDLVVQRLDQVPESIQPILRRSWGDNFESYNVVSGEGTIRGIRCKITQDQWNRLNDWEFGEFGWFVPKEVQIRDQETGQIEKIVTFVMGEGQAYDRKVDGLNYDPFLMPREKTLEVASKARQLYDERSRLEGKNTAFEVLR